MTFKDYIRENKQQQQNQQELEEFFSKYSDNFLYMMPNTF